MKKQKPKISAVMPFYNREKYIAQTIESVLNQTFTDFELIAIDDCSTDGSLKIVQEYAAKDIRIRVVKNDKNYHIAYSRNRGLELATSNIVAIIDSDDINMPDRFEKQYKFLAENPEIGIVGTHAYVIDEKGMRTEERITYKEDPEELAKTFFHLGPFLQPTTMVRKNEIIRIGGYREEYTLLDDMDMYYRFFLQGGKGANIPEYLVEYRRHRESTGIYVRERRDLMFNVKRELVKKHKPKMSFRDYVSMYVWYVLWLFMPERGMVCLENLIKKCIYR